MHRVGYDMLAKLELASFHAALFIVGSVLSYFLMPPPSLLGWLLFSGIFVTAVSRLSRAYSVARWKKVAPHGASTIVLVAHLAPAAAGYIFYLFVSHGTGSGILFLPFIAWALFFYPIGIIWTFIRLVQ